MRRTYFRKELNILFLYVIASCVLEVFGNIWAHVLHKPNHFMINTFAVVEYALISLMYREAFVGAKLKKLSLIVTLLFIVFAVTTFTNILGYVRFNSMVNTASCFIIIIWVFVYFYQLLQTLQIRSLSRSSLFWISVGILLYFSGTLFLFLYAEILFFETTPELSKQLWIIYFFLLLLFRIFLTIGLWFSKTPQQLNTSSK